MLARPVPITAALGVTLKLPACATPVGMALCVTEATESEPTRAVVLKVEALPKLA